MLRVTKTSFSLVLPTCSSSTSVTSKIASSTSSSSVIFRRNSSSLTAAAFFPVLNTFSNSCSSSVASSSPSSMLFTSFRFGYGFGGGERGKPRLSYEEKLARRTPKTREQKKAAEALVLEAENFVDVVLPDECTSEVEKTRERAQHTADKLLHPVTALFDAQVEISGQHKKLSQLATFVKTGAREYDVLPNQSAFLSPILQRLPRYDSSLTVSKQDKKVHVAIPPMTKNKRQHVAEQIRELKTKSKKSFTIIRRNAINSLEDLGLAQDLCDTRKHDAEEVVKKFEHELHEELEDIAQSVLAARGDDDDDDDGNDPDKDGRDGVI